MKKLLTLVVAMCVASGAPAYAAGRPASTHQRQMYVWHGQFVSLDQRARVATIEARILPHVERYVERFQCGARLILLWNMIGRTEADSVLALWQLSAKKQSRLDTGYVIPIEFISGNRSSHTVTFKVPLSSSALMSLTSMTPGEWIRVWTPMVQAPSAPLMAAIEKARPPSSAVAAGDTREGSRDQTVEMAAKSSCAGQQPF